MTSELDRMFEDWPSLRWPALRGLARENGASWSPKIEVFERDNRLVTSVDLPGMKKEDISVEVADGQLTLSGERKNEREEKKDNVYRSECEYGRFFRSVPMPAGVKPEDVKATFKNGVLEVSTPLPPQPQKTSRRIEVQEPAKG